ncbi:hypothetical protein KsCSTR_12910 [Candidatus Kuenenia stuttgartiensis]|uniref:Uncharacterized protein n=1 Tax=Kuenenia stuttgartiensis TaxID=174633 RepID=A0A6G7GM26_KUEST|nr:hypothetical protein KsCSTR_12910 [Candidatus Kuenenia stuttgartiensis]
MAVDLISSPVLGKRFPVTSLFYSYVLDKNWYGVNPDKVVLSSEIKMVL